MSNIEYTCYCEKNQSRISNMPAIVRKSQSGNAELPSELHLRNPAMQNFHQSFICETRQCRTFIRASSAKSRQCRISIDASKDNAKYRFTVYLQNPSMRNFISNRVHHTRTLTIRAGLSAPSPRAHFIHSSLKTCICFVCVHPLIKVVWNNSYNNKRLIFY